MPAITSTAAPDHAPKDPAPASREAQVPSHLGERFASRSIMLPELQLPACAPK